MKKNIIIIILAGVFLVLAPVQADSLGQQVVFNIDSGYDVAKRTEATATLRAMGQYIYFYVDNEYWDNLSSSAKNSFRSTLKDLADEFDTNIYPKERAVFGSEWNPGIDNDTRITVLMLQLIDEAGGYINTLDEYLKSEYANSNQREMFYINALYIHDARAKAFMAHEFQHLINFYQKTKLYGLEEEVWLNEALSEYAPTLVGYDDVYLSSNLSRRVNLFLESPKDSLTEWKNKLADYGSVSLFIHYLVDHYSKDILNKMALSNKTGMASIDQALADLGYLKTFADVFADWLVANYLNDCSVEPTEQYCYLNEHLTYQRLHIDPTASYSGFPNLVISRSSAIKDWASNWYRFRAQPQVPTDKDTLKMEFIGSKERGDWRVPYIVTDKNNQTIVGSIALSGQKGEILIPNFISQAKSLIIAPFNQYKKKDFNSSEPATSFSFTASSISQSNFAINSISPASGLVNGGAKVTISGLGFSQGAQVKFGDQESTSVDVVSENKIEAIAPAHLAGQITISVILPDQSIASINGFTYTELVVSYPNGSLLRAKDDFKVYVIEGSYKRWIQTAEIFNAYGHLRWSDIIDVESVVINSYQEAWLIRAAGDKKVYEVNADGTKHWINMTAEQFSISGYLWDMVYIINEFERDFYITGTDVLFR